MVGKEGISVCMHGISVCMHYDLYFKVNRISLVLEDKCALSSAGVICCFSLAHAEEMSACSSWELSFLKGFVAWTCVSLQSCSH